MRRILAFFLCVFLFAVPVNAANAAASVKTTATVNENSACIVTIEAEIRLDEPARGIKFPLGTDIRSVTLNGTALAQGTGYTYDETTGAFSTVPGVITVPAATYTQDPVTGIYTGTPGLATLTVTGTI